MLVIHNANIHTLDSTQPVATALVVDRGCILAIGNDDEILPAFSNAEKINVNKHPIIPGLTDSHIHLQAYALSLQKIDAETQSQKECLQRVAKHASESPQGEWILGHGWNHNVWPEGYGSAKQLDEIAPNHPVYLTHKSLHCAWANSTALQLAQIDRTTPDPPGGRIGRLENGDPNGILFESAMDLVERAIPIPGLDSVVRTIQSAQSLLWKMGLTGVHDFDGSQCFSALQILHQSNRLKLHVVKGIPSENLHQAIELGLRSGFGDDTLSIGSLKLFSDGALGPHTAAMLQPYEDDPTNSGILMLDAEELFELGMQASSNGLSMAVHAIGDRANHEVLNAFSQLRAYERSHQSTLQYQLRHRIEHVQVLHPDDLNRFSQLEIIASMQPIHATSDMTMADKFWGKRSTYAYAWRAQLDEGYHLIFGSDAPVENPNPFLGLHAAVTRQRADGSPSNQGWYPNQRITIDEALHAYTTRPAFAAHKENRLGMLAPGYLADLLVLNEDPFSCPPEALLDIHPIGTMISGEWVFREME